MIDRILEIATQIRSPLALSGLMAAIFFLIARQMVSKVPKPGQETGAKILRTTLVLLFVLSMTAMLLGFAGYVVDRIPLASNALPEPVLCKIIGVVRENDSKQVPVVGALIRIDEKMLTVPAQPDGTFVMEVRARKGESFLIRASAPGFAESAKWVRAGEFASLSLDREHRER